MTKQTTNDPSVLTLKRLPRSFYLQPTLRVARQLIGKYFVRQQSNSLLIGRIVEVEAYMGKRDPASHAFRGKTKRNEVMFWHGGYLYVYFTYGMHYCCNVVTEKEGTGHAVLLRAVEPLAGVEVMAQSRGRVLTSEKHKRDLCRGPAKLCQAYGITREENGMDLCADEIWIAEARSKERACPVIRTSRIGIRRGIEHRWRYCLRDSPFVSSNKSS